MNVQSSDNQRELHQSRSDGYERLALRKAELIDSRTGLVFERLVETRYCPACDSANMDQLFVKAGGQYHRCRYCRTIFLNPVLRDEELKAYYQENLSVQSQAHVDESDFYRRVYSSGLDLILKRIDSGVLLDIGCSGGLFLEMARERGFDVVGIELNRAECAIARQKRISVFDESLEDLTSDLFFDIVTLWDVFEHIKRPYEYLEIVRGHLRPGGLLMLQIPNSGSLSARVMRQHCNMFDGIEHVNLFNASSLESVLEQSGFSVVELVSVIDDRAAVLNYLSYEDPYSGSYNPDGELANLSPEFILDNGLGYKLQAIAQVAI